MSRRMAEGDDAVYRVRTEDTYGPSSFRNRDEVVVRYLGPYRTVGAAKSVRSKEIRDRKYSPNSAAFKVDIQVAHFEWEDFDATSDGQE